MARRLRVQFPGAVYHVTFRGNGGASIFDDDADRVRLTSGSAIGYLVRKVKSCAKRDSALRQQLESMTR